MRIKLLFTTWALLLANTALASGMLSLRPGQMQVLQFGEDIVELSLSKDDVVDVSIDPSKRKVTVVGQKMGHVLINARLRSGQHETFATQVGSTPVAGDAKASAAAEAAAAVRKIAGVTTEIRQGKVIVSGRIANSKKGDELADLKARYPDLIIDKTDKPYRDTDLVRDVINQTLMEKGFKNYLVRNIGKVLYLEGSPRSPEEKELVLKVARLVDPFVEDGIRDKRTKLGDTVAIDVMFLERSLDSSLDAGFSNYAISKNTPAGLASLAYPERTVPIGRGPLTWTIAPFRMMLNLFATKQTTKVLQNPRVIVRSGEKAEFLSGDEIYFTYYNVKEEENTAISSTQVVERKTVKIETGVKLEVVPIVDSLKQIGLDIALKVSNFKTDHDSGTPGSSVSETKTSISLKDGYSALLTGFKGMRKSKQVSRIPFLADIPLLGEIFKVRQFKDRETEIMVLLTVRTNQLSDDEKTLFEVVEKARILPNKMVELDKSASSELEFSVFD